MCSFSKKRDIPCLKLWILKIGFFCPKIFFQEKLVIRYLSTHKSSYFIIGFSSQLKMEQNSENKSEWRILKQIFTQNWCIFCNFFQIINCLPLLIWVSFSKGWAKILCKNSKMRQILQIDSILTQNQAINKNLAPVLRNFWRCPFLARKLDLPPRIKGTQKHFR